MPAPKKKPGKKPPAPPPPPPPPPEPTTPAALAAAIGVSKRTLQDYFERGCPRTGLAAIQRWRGDNLSGAKRRGDGGAAPPTSLTGDSPYLERAELEKQKLREEVRAKRLKNDLAEGLFCRRDEVQHEVAKLCLRIKARLEQLPGEIEIVVPSKLRAGLMPEIETKVRLLLKEMAAWAL
jgi:hypothetical protein